MKTKGRIGKCLAAFTVLAVVLLLTATLAYAQAATSKAVAATPLSKEALDKLPKAGSGQVMPQSGSAGAPTSPGGAGGGKAAALPAESVKSLYHLPSGSNGSEESSGNTGTPVGITGAASGAPSKAPESGSPGLSAEGSEGASALSSQAQVPAVQVKSVPEPLPSQQTPTVSSNEPKPQGAEAKTSSEAKPKKAAGEQPGKKTSVAAKISGFFKKLLGRR
ncbi:hypothetical protein HYY73_04120 [Candidatus Woesearchaeota archaeon]|nr:hypothetical protein [Candidatus Woesearchaeota archaeon]